MSQAEFDALKGSSDPNLLRLPWKTAAAVTSLLTSSGTGNDFVVSDPRAPTSLSGGMELRFTSSLNITGAATLAVNGLPAKPLRRSDNTEFGADQIKIGFVVIAVYVAAEDAFLVKSALGRTTITNQLRPPTAGFTWNITGLAVQFTNTSTSLDTVISSYLWDFGDGTISSQKDPAHVFPSPGIYTVTLTVTDSVGRRATKQQSFNLVNTRPTSQFSYSANGLTVNFTDNSTDVDGTIVAWLWDFGDSNTSTVRHPQHTYLSSGTYTITLTVTDDRGAQHTSSASITVPVGLTPTANFSVITNALQATFSDLSIDLDGTVSSWLWDFGDGSTSTVQNPVHLYSAGGQYTVQLTVTDSQGLSNTTSQQLVVSVSDSPTAAFTTNNTTGLGLVNITDASSDPDGTITNWNWFFGEGDQFQQNQPHVLTVKAKSISAHNNSIEIWSNVTSQSAIFNLATGTVDSVAAGADNATIVDAGGGWYECHLFVTAPSSGAIPDFIITVRNGTSTAVVGQQIAIEYAQLIQGTAAAPYGTVPNLLYAAQSFSDSSKWFQGVSTPITVTDNGALDSFGNNKAALLEVASTSETALIHQPMSFGPDAPVTSTAQNPNHTYAASGSYDIGLTVRDNSGIAAEAYQPINVTVNPPLGFSTTPQFPQVSDPLGNTSTLTIPITISPSGGSGNYEVTLTVTANSSAWGAISENDWNVNWVPTTSIIRTTTADFDIYAGWVSVSTPFVDTGSIDVAVTVRDTVTNDTLSGQSFSIIIQAGT